MLGLFYRCGLPPEGSPYDIVANGDVLNYTIKVMKLTCGKLTQQQDWDDWQSSEYLQMNQYKDQGMFGPPIAVTEDNVVTHLVWTTILRLPMDKRRPAASAIVLRDQVKFRSLPKQMPTASIK
jgi:hypothetical protein